MRRPALLIAVATIAFAAATASAPSEPLPVGWWNSSPWTRIEAPHTPAGYIRLYEPRSEVLGDLGKPDYQNFLCPPHCNRRLAAQLDAWNNARTDTTWIVIFTRRASVATPRTAVGILAGGRGWAYHGLHGWRRAGRLWLQSAIPCGRHAFRIPPYDGHRESVLRWIACTRTVRQRFGRHAYKLRASVVAVGHLIRGVTLVDERALRERVGRGEVHRGSVAESSQLAQPSPLEQAERLLDDGIANSR